jgi:hypothetical protein
LEDKLVYQISRRSKLFSSGRREPPQLGDRISFARYVHFFTRVELESELCEAGFRLKDYKDEGDWGNAIGISE